MRSVFLRPVLSLLGATALSAAAMAQCPEEAPQQHWTGGGTVTCPCFVAGEEWGAAFPDIPPAHYPIQVLRVGFGWGSQGGGQPDSLEQRIKVYNGGLPNPGAPIFTLDGPVLSDGFINEFDLTAGNIIVNSGTVSVTIELANDSTLFGANPVHDGNGCTGGGRNLVKAIPGGWANACSLGVSGDWLVHLVYRRVSCGGGIGTASCFGVGCPCGNDYATAGCANSTGVGGFLTGSGSTSVLNDDLVLTATGLAPQNQGLYYMGDTVVSNLLYDGRQCALGNTFRYLASIQNTGPFGEMSYTGWVAASGGMITPGSTWHFHAWHRDVPGTPCGTGANLTNLYSVTFTP